jgi:hypothetical protein
MHIQLNERRLNATEAVYLPGFDHQNVAGTGLELFTVHHVQGAAGLDELDFIVRVAVRSRPTPCSTVEQEGRNANRALAGADELVGAAAKRETAGPPGGFSTMDHLG